MKIPELVWRIPLGALGGLLALYAFPTENIWILAPLIPALILLATLESSARWIRGKSSLLHFPHRMDSTLSGTDSLDCTKHSNDLLFCVGCWSDRLAL